jgi:hypothetical protein
MAEITVTAATMEVNTSGYILFPALSSLMGIPGAIFSRYAPRVRKFAYEKL